MPRAFANAIARVDARVTTRHRRAQYARQLVCVEPAALASAALDHLAAPGCSRLRSTWDRCGVYYVEPIETGMRGE